MRFLNSDVAKWGFPLPCYRRAVDERRVHLVLSRVPLHSTAMETSRKRKANDQNAPPMSFVAVDPTAPKKPRRKAQVLTPSVIDENTRRWQEKAVERQLEMEKEKEMEQSNKQVAEEERLGKAWTELRKEGE